MTKFDFEKELFGAILVRLRRLSGDQLEKALLLQQQGDTRLIGEILVRQGALDEMDVVQALIQQWDFPYMDPGRYTGVPSVLSLVPEELLWRGALIPLDKVGDVLSVVMANPLDGPLLEEVSRRTRCRVAAFIAAKEQIRAALARCFSGKNSDG